MNILFEETIPGGWAWSHILKKDTAIKITDIEGGACGALTFFNPKDLSERFNMPDTLKGQYTAVISGGHALYSDMGRIQLSVIEDTFGRHDPVCGLITQEEIESRFGIKRYQEYRNQWFESGLNHLWVEMGKYCLDIRDLSSILNLFSSVIIKDDGAIKWDDSKCKAGNYIILQAEMDTLVFIAATQHPFDPGSEWSPKPLGLTVMHSSVKEENNPAWLYSEQNKRGFTNTFRYNV